MTRPQRSYTTQSPGHRRLGLGLVTLDGRWGREDVGVEITIDGTPLLTLVRDCETRSGVRRFGAYWPPSLENLWLVEQRIDGRWRRATPGSLGDDSLAPVLVCECGDPWCGGLFATVRIVGDTVSWGDLSSTESDHRRGHYRSIDPLLFERRAYFKALSRLEPGIGAVVKRRNAAWADAREARRRARGRAAPPR